MLDAAPRPEAAGLLTPRQLWIAARRLASGETERVAASAAGVRARDLRAAMDADPDLRPLIDDFRAIKALPPEAKRARLADLCWDAAERAVLDGRVSTVNQCVRGLDLLDGPVEGDEDDDGPDDDWDPLAEMAAGARAFRRTLTPELRAEFDALDQPRSRPDREDEVRTAPGEPLSTGDRPSLAGTPHPDRRPERAARAAACPPPPADRADGDEGAPSAADTTAVARAGPTSAGPIRPALDAPRPNHQAFPHGRPAREPLPPWHGDPSGRARPRWGP